jgi:hypothetical protein
MRGGIPLRLPLKGDGRGGPIRSQMEGTTSAAKGKEEGADLRLVQKASTHWVDADIKRACASMLFLKFAEACARNEI